MKPTPPKESMLATQPETMLAEAIARGVCVYRSCSFPRESKGHGLRSARPYAAHGRRGRKPRWGGVPSSGLATRWRWGPWGRRVSAGTVEHTGTCHMSETGEQEDHGIDQAHVTQDRRRSLRFHPVTITTVTPEARAARLACRTLGSPTRPVLDASRPLALALLCHHGLATVS